MNSPRPFNQMNLFQPFDRLRAWSETDGAPELDGIKQDVAHVLDSHERIWRQNRENEPYIWYYPNGKEGGAETWRDYALELRAKLYSLDLEKYDGD